MEILVGRVQLYAKESQSYEVRMQVQIEGTNTSSSNILYLKNPYKRFKEQATPGQLPPGPACPPAPPGQSRLDPLRATQATNFDDEGYRRGFCGGQRGGGGFNRRRGQFAYGRRPQDPQPRKNFDQGSGSRGGGATSESRGGVTGPVLSYLEEAPWLIRSAKRINMPKYLTQDTQRTMPKMI